MIGRARPDVLLGALLLGCIGPGCATEEDPTTGGQPLDALAIEVAGCAAIWRDGGCALGDSDTLTIWVRTPAGDPAQAALTGTLDGAPITLRDLQPVAGGLRAVLELPRRTGRLEITRTDEAGEARAVRTLRLEAESPALDAIQARLKAEDAGDDAGAALRELARLEASKDPDLAARAIAARVSYLVRTRRLDEAEDAFDRLIAACEVAGRVRELAWNGTALAHRLEERRAGFGRVRALLDRASGGLEADPENASLLVYTRGLVERDAGNLALAAEKLADAEGRAERLGKQGWLRAFRQVRARLYRRLGDLARAEALLERLVDGLAPDDRSKTAAHLLNNLGWVRLMAFEEGRPTDGDPVPPLLEALERWRGLPSSAEQEASVLVNLALAALQEDRLEVAASRLAEARKLATSPPMFLATWLEELQARVELATDDAVQAARRYDVMIARAAASGEGAAEWRARVGRGRALEALGRDEDAIAEYRGAERLLSRQVPGVPIGSQAGLLGNHLESGRRLIEVLLRGDRKIEALDVARRARRRALLTVAGRSRRAGLRPDEHKAWEEAVAAYQVERAAIDEDAASDWSVPADRLPALRGQRAERLERLEASVDRVAAVLGFGRGLDDLELRRSAPGELLLTWFFARERWLAFAETTGGVSVARLEGAPPTDPERLSAWLLGPFRDQIQAAERLRVASWGALAAVDVHALPLGGAPVIARLPVVYTLDGPGRVGADRARSALVVVDPQENLAGTHAEVGAVTSALGELRPRVLRGPEAGGAAVRSALSEVTWFHYAGHARYAGAGGWDSVLPLAAGSTLSIGDILASPAVPDNVVLSACEAARSGGTEAVGMGLAHAFLARGSHTVIAPTRAVDDGAAARLSRGLYEGPVTEDPARALRTAQLAMLAEGEMGWAAWRCLEHR